VAEAGPLWVTSLYAEYASESWLMKAVFQELKNHHGSSITLTMNNDQIGDFIIRVKNAGNVGKESISVPFSKMKFAIAELLSSKGYLGTVTKKAKGNAKFLNIDLLYREDGSPVVSEVRRVSKPSRRLYEKAKDIKRFRRGYGLSIFSTPKGIMSDMDAKKENLGGEFLFNIW